MTENEKMTENAEAAEVEIPADAETAETAEPTRAEKKKAKKCEAEIEALKKQLDTKSAECDAANDRYLRMMAEYDNFRKRSQKEKEMAYGDTKASTIAEFLPVYDNFIRAMSTETTDLESFKKGIEMIFNQYGETFKKLGVESFGEKGETFDPNIHNAVMHVEDEEAGENIIVEEFQKGYLYKEFVIRYSMVKVAN